MPVAEAQSMREHGMRGVARYSEQEQAHALSDVDASSSIAGDHGQHTIGCKLPVVGTYFMLLTGSANTGLAKALGDSVPAVGIHVHLWDVIEFAL